MTIQWSPRYPYSIISTGGGTDATFWQAEDTTLSGGTNYSIDADLGTFALTGNTVTLQVTAILVSAPGTFTEVEQSSPCRVDYSSSLAAGSFTTTGSPVSLRVDCYLPAASGLLSLTGQDAVFTGLREHVAAGTFTETGQAVSCRVDYRTTCAVGSFTATGNAVSLRVDRYIPVAPGLFSLTGQDLLFGGVTERGAVGTFIETGNDVALTSALVLTAAPGIFLALGTASALRVDHVVPLVDALFTLSGSSVSVVLQGQLLVSPGTYTETGQDVALASTLILTADPGVFLEVGVATFLQVNRVVPLVGDLFTLSGSSVSLVLQGQLSVSSGTYTALGSDTLPTTICTLLPAPGTFTATGHEVDFGGVITVQGSTGTFTEVGQDIVLRHAALLTGNPGIYTLSGAVIDVGTQRYLSVSPGVFNATGSGVTLSVGTGASGQGGSHFLSLLSGLLRDYPANSEYRKLAADFGIDAHYTYSATSAVSLITGTIHPLPQSQFLQAPARQYTIHAPRVLRTGRVGVVLHTPPEPSAFLPSAPRCFNPAYQGVLTLSALGAPDQVYSYLPVTPSQHYHVHQTEAQSLPLLHVCTESTYITAGVSFCHTHSYNLEALLLSGMNESCSHFHDIRQSEDELLYILDIL